MGLPYHALALLVSMVVLVYKSEGSDLDMMSFSVLKSRGMSSEEYRRKALEYWTPARIRAAKPVETKPRNPKFNQTSQQGASRKRPDGSGPPIAIDGQLPDQNGTVLGRLISSKNQVVKTVGKVYMSDGYGDYVCSGAVVTAPSGSLIVTAAHCIYDRDTDLWYNSYWLFKPAYDYGDEPLLSWTGIYFTIPTRYANVLYSEANYNFDYGFVVVDRIAGRKISQITGSLGIAFNQPRYQLTYSFGYPVDIGDGEIMSACISRPVQALCGSSDYIGQALRCGMGGGCNGGPWIQNFVDKTGAGYMTGLNSYTCDSDPYMRHGPYFDKNTKSSYDQVKTRLS